MKSIKFWGRLLLSVFCGGFMAPPELRLVLDRSMIGRPELTDRVTIHKVQTGFGLIFYKVRRYTPDYSVELDDQGNLVTKFKAWQEVPADFAGMLLIDAENFVQLAPNLTLSFQTPIWADFDLPGPKNLVAETQEYTPEVLLLGLALGVNTDSAIESDRERPMHHDFRSTTIELANDFRLVLSEGIDWNDPFSQFNPSITLLGPAGVSLNYFETVAETEGYGQKYTSPIVDFLANHRDNLNYRNRFRIEVERRAQEQDRIISLNRRHLEALDELEGALARPWGRRL